MLFFPLVDCVRGAFKDMMLHGKNSDIKKRHIVALILSLFLFICSVNIKLKVQCNRVRVLAGCVHQGSV